MASTKNIPADHGPLFAHAEAIAKHREKILANGALNFDYQLRIKLNQIIKSSGLNRFEIAAKMSMLLFGEDGEEEITKTQLDTYTAPSRTGHKFPLNLLPAFCMATNDFSLIKMVVELMGLEICIGDEAAFVELGKAVAAEAAASKRKDELVKSLTPENVMHIDKNGESL